MAGIRIKGFVYVDAEAREQRAFVFPYRSEATCFGVCVGPIDVEHELPEGLDLQAEALRQEIAALQEQRLEAGRKFAAAVNSIDDRLAKLQALEYTPAAEPEFGR